MTMRHSLGVSLGFLLAVAEACSTSTPIGVVDDQGASTTTMGSAGAGGAPAQGPYVPSAPDVVDDKPFTNPAGLADDWVGYLESYSTLTPGLDVVRLHFATDAGGNETLTVVRGMGTVPPPPTDPYQPWPAALVNADGQPSGADPFPDPMPGFGFTAHEVTWQGQRLTFVILAAEPWAPWCGLQTSYPVHGPDGAINGYSCARGLAYTVDGGVCRYTSDPAARCDLNHDMMCAISKICSCNATGCGAEASLRMGYDITFSSDHAEGTGEEHSLILMPAAPSP